VPAQATPQLLQGFDMATQITALAQWLQRQQRPLPKRVWIATDPDHTARAVLNAQIALGPRGIQVGPPPAPAYGWPPNGPPANGPSMACDSARIEEPLAIGPFQAGPPC